MQKLKIPERYHKDHKQWLSKIEFYFDQIRIFQNELSHALMEQKNLFSLVEHVEEYKQILIKKIKRLTNLKHQIIYHERAIAYDFSLTTIVLWDHHQVKTEIEQFEIDFNEFKNNFRKFIVSAVSGQ